MVGGQLLWTKDIIWHTFSTACVITGFVDVGEDIVFLATDISLPGAVDW